MLISLIRRFAAFCATLFVLAALTFFLLRALPGSPFDRETPLSPEARAAVTARYGLDEALPLQFLHYLGGALRFDFGPSYRYPGETVREIVGRTAPFSLGLGALALGLALLLGVPAGVLAAGRRRGWGDFLVRAAAVATLSLPSFLAGALLIYFFSLKWALFPAAFYEGPRSLLLPALTLALLPAAQVARLVRASLLEHVNSDFVRAARARGAGEGRLLWRHALRNSLLPLLTLLAPLVANTLTGTFVVESLFALPGMGAGFVEAVANRDYPLAVALTLLYGALFAGANLLVECAYAWADPRLRREGRR